MSNQHSQEPQAPQMPVSDTPKSACCKTCCGDFYITRRHLESKDTLYLCELGFTCESKDLFIYSSPHTAYCVAEALAANDLMPFEYNVICQSCQESAVTLIRKPSTTVNWHANKYSQKECNR